MARHGLAFHLNRLAQILPPLLFYSHTYFHSGGEVAHDEGSVVSVPVAHNFGELKTPASVSDEPAGSSDRLKGYEASKEVVHLGKPRTFFLKLSVRDVSLFNPDLSVPVPEVATGLGYRQEGDGASAPESRTDESEHLRLLHQVTLNALVDGPVVARPVLGRHSYNLTSFNWGEIGHRTQDNGATASKAREGARFRLHTKHQRRKR